MPRLPKMARENCCEIGVALGRDDTQRVANRPKHEPCDPLLEAQPQGRRDGAVDDRERARRSTQEDGFREGSMDRRLEPLEMMR